MKIKTNRPTIKAIESREMRFQKYQDYAQDIGISTVVYDEEKDWFVIVTDMPDGSVKTVESFGLDSALMWAEIANEKYAH